MKEIKLSKGKFAIVDDEDYEILIRKKWYCSFYGYAVRTERDEETKIRSLIRMHRLIMNCPDGKEIDHINNNPLDNRKSNLRICERGENCKNIRKPKTNTSGYKGVSLTKNKKKYRANITINNKQKYLGQFETLKDAAIAYNNAAIENYGQFANLNIIED